ncbi:MAG: class II aldolase/adducin family protein [Thermomicrobiales bacterium]|nr:class II aldolase/adducin family protein [Thermomicrobiales bacterium]
MTWSPEIQPFAERVVESARRLVEGHAVLSHSQHGNISIRLPDAKRFLLTGVGALADLQTTDLALLSTDGDILDGQIGPASNEIIQMHAAVYRRRPDINGIVHTHSPYVTSFAIANKPIEPTYEAMVRFDINEAVPVAAYGARGSDRSVSNIIDVVNDTNKAVLLANHGLLAFDDTLEKATHLVFVLEEAAQFSLMANVIGGAQALPPEAIRQTQERRVEFERTGVVSADDE